MDKDNQLETKPLEQNRLRLVKQCLTCSVKSQQMLINIEQKTHIISNLVANTHGLSLIN